MVADETDHLLDRLGDDALRQIALWRMEGYSSDEIADRSAVPVGPSPAVST